MVTAKLWRLYWHGACNNAQSKSQAPTICQPAGSLEQSERDILNLRSQQSRFEERVAMIQGLLQVCSGSHALVDWNWYHHAAQPQKQCQKFCICSVTLISLLLSTSIVLLMPPTTAFLSCLQEREQEVVTLKAQLSEFHQPALAMAGSGTTVTSWETETAVVTEPIRTAAFSGASWVDDWNAVAVRKRDSNGTVLQPVPELPSALQSATAPKARYCNIR